MDKQKKKSLLSRVLSFGARDKAEKAKPSKIVNLQKRKNILHSFRLRNK